MEKQTEWRAFFTSQRQAIACISPSQGISEATLNSSSHLFVFQNSRIEGSTSVSGKYGSHDICHRNEVENLMMSRSTHSHHDNVNLGIITLKILWPSIACFTPSKFKIASEK